MPDAVTSDSSTKKPGGIPANAGFDFDFVEFALGLGDPIFENGPKQPLLNVDTSQVDQLGMPIYLQTDPIAPDFAHGTGIVPTQTRAEVIEEFRKYTTNSPYAAYRGVIGPTGPQRCSHHRMS